MNALVLSKRADFPTKDKSLGFQSVVFSDTVIVIKASQLSL